MNELKVLPLPVVESNAPFVPTFVSTDESAFIDETVVRQMILDGQPDDLPRTGNPSLPNQAETRQFPYPLAFAG